MGMQKKEVRSSHRRRTSKTQKKKTIRHKGDEFALTKRFKQGDLSSLTPILKSYKNLVKTVAEHYEHHGLAKSELIHFGNIGLIKAAHRFDESKGVIFKSYSIWWIRQSILKALHEQEKIDQIPHILIMNLHKISQTFNAGELIHDKEPTDEQINEALKSQIDEFAKAINHSNTNA